MKSNFQVSNFQGLVLEECPKDNKKGLKGLDHGYFHPRYQSPWQKMKCDVTRRAQREVSLRTASRYRDWAQALRCHSISRYRPGDEPEVFLRFWVKTVLKLNVSTFSCPRSSLGVIFKKN